jgi:hypothetical protein
MLGNLLSLTSQTPGSFCSGRRVVQPAINSRSIQVVWWGGLSLLLRTGPMKSLRLPFCLLSSLAILDFPLVFYMHVFPFGPCSDNKGKNQELNLSQYVRKGETSTRQRSRKIRLQTFLRLRSRCVLSVCYDLCHYIFVLDKTIDRLER